MAITLFDVYTLHFQVIIPGCWIFSLIFNTPLFLIVKFDKKTKWCVGAWPEQWMASAVNVAWLVLTVLPLALMVGLYSRIVYTLWFKRNDDNQHTHQQKVIITCWIHQEFFCSVCHVLRIPQRIIIQ